MKKDCIKVGELRIKKSSIKKYRDFSDAEIALNFSSSANVYETETIKFKTQKLKDECLDALDLMFDGELFIVGKLRILLSTIKKYKPVNGVKLSVYYSTSKSKVIVDVFEFKNTKEREEYLLELDIKKGVA